MTTETKALLEQYLQLPPGFYPNIFSCPCDPNDRICFYRSNDDQIRAWLEWHKNCDANSRKK